MAREKTSMELREIIIRLRKEHGIKKIHRETGTHREVIRKLKSIALSKGWLNEGELPNEKEILRSYYSTKENRENVLSSFHDELARYAREDISYVVMHRLIGKRAGVSETTVRRYVQKHIRSDLPKETVERKREKSVMEVDFGRLGIVYDGRVKANRVAYVFSGRLRYSGNAYREIVYDQKQETFFECHIKAFEYFGRVPGKVVPDNLKAAVIKASFTDPLINRGYHDLAEYYGFQIDPCPPYTPRLKGGVESDIKYVKKNFYAEFRMKEQMFGHDIPKADNILPALREWERETANTRIIKSIGKSPNELFEDERAYLKSLPSERYSIVLWSKTTVRGNGLVNFDRSRYSVPDKYIGKEVLIAADMRRIRVFYDHELIARHERSQKPYQDVVKEDHQGKRARAYIEYSRDNLLAKAESIGPYTKELCRILLLDHVVSRERSVHGIITLASKYGAIRVERACFRALAYDNPAYITVKRILRDNLDDIPAENPVDSYGQRSFVFARSGGYFNTITIKE